jgi:IrrE N-terminal-like domain
MFQPLDKLIGAYLPGEEVGVLITTKRPLPVQRFTGAHELGHSYMRHKPSLDDENILRRAPFSTSGRLDRQEREADAFASMFLTPAWLLALNLERQGWTAHDLENPSKVYQASLRIGTSYTTTCYALTFPERWGIHANEEIGVRTTQQLDALQPTLFRLIDRSCFFEIVDKRFACLLFQSDLPASKLFYLSQS